eukprot:403360103
MTIAGAAGALAVGYDSGIVAGTLLYIDKDFPNITLEEKSRFVSFAVLGGTIGAILAGSLCEKMGRKYAIIFSAILLILGPLLLVLTKNINLYCIWRIIIGFGMGLNMMAAQVFMSESSPNKLRGTIGSMYILSIFLGFIFSHISSLLFEFQLNVMFMIGVIPAILQILLMVLTQRESPTYVAIKGTPAQVATSLRKFYITNNPEGMKALDLHYKEILASTTKKDTQQSQYQLYVELLTKYRWNLFVAVMLHVLQQFTGINIVQYYGPSIMKDAGFGGDSHRDLLYSMVFLTIVNTTANFVGAMMAQKYGRRQLIMMFSIPMGISLALLTAVMIINARTEGGFALGGYICILSLAGYLIFFCIGFATQAWTVSAEVFPNHLRGIANSITTTSNWLFNFLTSAIFLQITATNSGKIIAYSILSISCVITYLFVRRYLPETKDKPIDECVKLVMQARYLGCHNDSKLSKNNGDSLTSEEDIETKSMKKGLLDSKPSTPHDGPIHLQFGIDSNVEMQHKFSVRDHKL